MNCEIVNLGERQEFVSEMGGVDGGLCFRDLEVLNFWQWISTLWLICLLEFNDLACTVHSYFQMYPVFGFCFQFLQQFKLNLQSCFLLCSVPQLEEAARKHEILAAIVKKQMDHNQRMVFFLLVLLSSAFIYLPRVLKKITLWNTCNTYWNEKTQQLWICGCWQKWDVTCGRDMILDFV